jgi:predicted transcriptional regulator
LLREDGPLLNDHRRSSSMTHVKEEAKRLIDELPDAATYVRDAIERGEDDVANGRTVSQEEVELEILGRLHGARSFTRLP